MRRFSEPLLLTPPPEALGAEGSAGDFAADESDTDHDPLRKSPRDISVVPTVETRVERPTGDPGQSLGDWAGVTAVDDDPESVVRELMRLSASMESELRLVVDEAGQGPGTEGPAALESTDSTTGVWERRGEARALAPRAGQVVVGDRYVVEEVLATGGMARILRVVHIGLGKELALKVIQPMLVTDTHVREHFFREARMSAQMSHPNIVQVTDFGIDPKFGAYLVMECLKGETVRARVRSGGPFSVWSTLNVACQTAQAVEHMHRRNVIHCDVKSENIFLSTSLGAAGPSETVKLIDLGLARNQALDAKLARTEVAGTPEYASPEQIRGSAPCPSMDIYSLGVLMYEMLTGRLPFAGTPREMMLAHLHDPPPPPSAVMGEPPDPEVEALILKALDKKPERRPPNMARLVFDLDSLMERTGPAVRGGFDNARPHRASKRQETDPDEPLAAQVFSVFRNCPCPLFRLDREARILEANPAFCQFVRDSRQQLCGRHVLETRLRSIFPDVGEEILKAVQSGFPAPVVRKASFQAGSGQVTVKIELVPELDRTGKVAHFTGIVLPAPKS